MDHRDRWVGIACAVGVLIIWTGFNLASRAGVRGDLPPADIAFLRFAVAGLAVTPWLIQRGLGAIGLGRAAVLALCAGVGFSLFTYWGFVYAPASHAAVLLAGILPLLTAVLAIPMLGQWPVGSQAWGLVALGLAVVLLLWDSVLAASGQLWGDALFLVASCHWAVFTVLLRRWRVNPIDATVAVYVISAIIYVPAYLLVGGFRLPSAAWTTIAFQAVYQGAISTVVSMILFTRAVALLGPGPTAMLTAFVPAAAALAAIPVLGEIPTPRTWLGIAAAATGVALAVASLRPSGTPRSP